MTLLPSREPKICWNCCDNDTINQYEQGKEPRKAVITILGKGAYKYGWYCKKCDFARPIETKTPLYWVTCYKCGEKIINTEKDICPKCR